MADARKRAAPAGNAVGAASSSGGASVPEQLLEGGETDRSKVAKTNADSALEAKMASLRSMLQESMAAALAPVNNTISQLSSRVEWLGNNAATQEHLGTLENTMAALSTRLSSVEEELDDSNANYQG